MTTFSERLIEKMAPWNKGPVGPSDKTDLEIWLTAAGSVFEQVEEIAAEVGSDGEAGYVPPYGKLLNPNLCPKDALAYLGQFVGVEIPPGASEEEARKLIRAEAGLERGTRKSLEVVIRRTLALAEPSFPSLTATDTFIRANENPLSNGGKWSELGTYETGEVFANTYTAGGEGVARAYWNVSTEARPAVSIEVAGLPVSFPTGSLFACLTNTNQVSGYELRWAPQAKKGYMQLARYDNEVQHILTVAEHTLEPGESLGLGVRNGVVSGWVKSAGVWTQVMETSDSTYTTGYAGIGVSGGGTYKNFALGEMPSSAAETFSIKERTGPSGEPAAYHFVVAVAPGGGTQALYSAINEVKPAGLFYTVTEATNTWVNGVKKHWSEVTVTNASEMIEPNY